MSGPRLGMVYVVAALDTATDTLRVRWKRTKKIKSEHGPTLAESISHLARDYGHVTAVDTDEVGRGILYLTMADVEGARQLRQRLDGQAMDFIGGRHVLVAFVHKVSTECYDAMTSGLKNVPSTTPLPEGLILEPEFVSLEAQENLIRDIESVGEWETNLSRRVKHFGQVFNYVTRMAEPGRVVPLPPSLTALATRISAFLGMEGGFDQITVNEYEPGQGISAHIDTHSAFGERIAVVSLAAATLVDFTDPLAELPETSVLVPARSLYVLAGPSRLRYKHGIARRKRDLIDGHVVSRETRLSLTLRTLRSGPCVCAYPTLCDSQQGPAAALSEIRSPVLRDLSVGQSLEDLSTPDIERKHVHELYETVAHHFSRTRYQGWPQVVSFLDQLPPGSLVVDVGCGNGRYLSPVGSRSICTVGSDICTQFVDICVNERGFEAAIADGMELPWRSALADVVLSIAVLHHISTEARRVAMLQELVRVVKPGGQILLEAWAREQEESSKRRFDAPDVMVPWKLPRNYLTPEAAEAAGPEQNMVEFQRYCHVFVKGEIPELFSRIEGVEVEREWYERSNWCVLVRRTL